MNAGQIGVTWLEVRGKVIEVSKGDPSDAFHDAVERSSSALDHVRSELNATHDVLVERNGAPFVTMDEQTAIEWFTAATHLELATATLHAVIISLERIREQAVQHDTGAGA